MIIVLALTHSHLTMSLQQAPIGINTRLVAGDEVRTYTLRSPLPLPSRPSLDVAEGTVEGGGNMARQA